MSHTNHDRSCYSKNSKFASIILLKSNILSIRHAQKCLVILVSVVKSLDVYNYRHY